MKQDLTEIIIVLDESGSMGSLANDIRGSFNTFMDDQRKVAGECRVTLCKLASTVSMLFQGKPLSEVENLTDKNYQPTGNTALWDGIGTACDSVGQRLGALTDDQRPAKVICLILTDGEENSSKEYTQDRIKEIVKTQSEKYSWQFIFMGSNQDAVLAAARINIPTSNSLNLMHTQAGYSAGVGSASANIKAFRSGVTLSAGFSQADRDKQS